MKKDVLTNTSVSRLITEDPASACDSSSSDEAPRLSDVIEISKLQKIQDSFALALDVSSVIVDLDSNLLTKPSNFSKVCEIIHQSEKGRKRCELSNEARNAKSRNRAKPMYHQCLSCGFVDGSAPIIIGDIHVADWLVGQCNVMGVTRDSVASYAEEIDVDVESMLTAFDEMPVIPIERFEKILELHYAIAQELSYLGHNNYRLNKEIAAKESISLQLRKSETLLKEFFASSMEGICIIDKDNRILFANPAIIQLFGLDSMESIIGKNIFSFFEQDQKDILQKQRENRQAGKSSKYEIRLKNIHNKDLYLLISATPRFDEDNQYAGAFASITDITEQKRLQEYISRAERLESAGRIAAQVAHDFNNLLGPLVAYPEIIKKHIPENSAASKLLSDIDHAANSMAEINQQLLTLGRRGHYNLEILNIHELINQSLENLKNDLPDVEVKLDLSDKIMNIKGGGSQLIRVLTNLISNSLDAMKYSGDLCIKTENYYIDHLNSIKYQIPQGEYVKVTIADSGCGISQELMPLIFDPFFTTKKSDIKRGSGLGLSVVHSVMQDHEGYISISSTPGEGTSVYLYFPLKREQVTSHEQTLNIRGKERLLVVDDDAVQRSVAENLLTDLGYIVTTCISGEKAIALISESEFDIVILDMIMPSGMDGAETYAEILKVKPNQKAIIVSGYADSMRVEQARKLGIEGFIAKPLTAATIGKAIREIIDNA